MKLPPTYDSTVHPENPADEPEIENSDRVTKSATPKYTLDWYVKWVASVMILVAVSIRSAGIDGFQIVDLWLSFTGCVLWLWVAMVWRDRSLMILNAVAGMLLFVGILKYYFEDPVIIPTEHYSEQTIERDE